MSMEFTGRVQAGKINVGVISVETTLKTSIHQRDGMRLPRK